MVICYRLFYKAQGKPVMFIDYVLSLGTPELFASGFLLNISREAEKKNS
jgi:hypothetical protein